MAEVPLTESLWCSPSDLSKFCEAFGRSEQFFLLSSAMVAHSMIGKHGFIFGIGQHGKILSSLCGKHLPNKHLYHIDSPWHDGCYLNYGMPIVWANFRALRL